jgi:hypothetical protein
MLAFKNESMVSEAGYSRRIRNIAQTFWEASAGRFSATIDAPASAPAAWPPHPIVAALLVAGALVVMAFLWRSRRTGPSRTFMLVAALTVFVAPAMALFRGMDRPWHVLTPYPAVVLVAALAAAYLWETLGSLPMRRRLAVVMGVIFFLVLGRAGWTAASAHLRDAATYGGIDLTSTAIRGVGARIKADGTVRRLIGVSYGVTSILYLLVALPELHYEDMAFTDILAPSGRARVLELASAGQSVFIFRESRPVGKLDPRPAAFVAWLNGPAERFRQLISDEAPGFRWPDPVRGVEGTAFYIVSGDELAAAWVKGNGRTRPARR